MDDFKFQIYSSNIERLKGTKAPLKRIINELFSEYLPPEGFAKEKDLSISKVIHIILKAAHFSTLAYPFTRAQEEKLRTLIEQIIRGYTLTPEELTWAFEFFSLKETYYTVYPFNAEQMITAFRYKEALSKLSIELRVYNYSLKLSPPESIERALNVRAHLEHGVDLSKDCTVKQLKLDMEELEEAATQIKILQKDIHEYINSADVE